LASKMGQKGKQSAILLSKILKYIIIL